MTFYFKPATIHELGAMNQLIKASKMSWGYPEQWWDLWTTILTATPTRLNKRPFWLCYNAVDNLVGLYSYSCLMGTTFELEDFFVSPSYKRNGIGATMFQHLRTQLALKNAQLLQITADPNAAPFYQKMGAVIVGEHASQPTGRLIPKLELVLTS